MSEPLTLSTAENKLNELNKNIVEIKKKVQLSGNDSNCIKYFSFIYIISDKSTNRHYTRLQSYQNQILFIQSIPLLYSIIC